MLTFKKSHSRLHQVVGRWLAYLKPHSDSTDYLTWRRQFLQQRLRLGLWLLLFWHLLISTEVLYSVLFDFARLRGFAFDFYGNTAIAAQWRSAVVVCYIASNILILTCLIAQRTAWGRRHPEALFLIFTCGFSNLAQVVFTFFGLPEIPGELFFLSVAVLIPIHWRLHLTYQVVTLGYYAIVYPITGLAALDYAQSYKLYSGEVIIPLACACSISILSVYLYERLKRSEFEAKRQLQIFLRSVSHDLQTPVVGSSVVLNQLLSKSAHADGDEVRVKRSTLERLLQGSDRQLALINSLLEAHSTEIQGISLHRKPLQLKPLVDSVLSDLHHGLTHKRVQFTNYITSDLPLVNADANQLWRVFSNLIGNALKHNPHEIQLTVDANVVEPQRREQMGARKYGDGEQINPLICAKAPVLLCVVQDNGVGIAPDQCQRLFELYSRGAKARYMPGLGLGLYLCKQIVEAHGGTIGVVSRQGEGSTFWFTLPLSSQFK